MVLAEFQRLLSGCSVDPVCKQVRSKLVPDLRHEELPSAQLYVVDAQGGEAATLALLANVLDQRPTSRLLVIAQTFTTESSYSFLRAGAKGLITYDDAREHLLQALSQVAEGGFWVRRAILSGFVDSILSASGRLKVNSATELSMREQEVLDGLLSNLANKEIAERLNISERTVKFHVSHLLEKFGVRRRADLILVWYQHHKSKPATQGIPAKKIFESQPSH